MRHHFVSRSRALSVCLLACLATTACDRNDAESKASGAGKNGEAIDGQSPSGIGESDKRQRDPQKSGDSNSPVVKAREEAKVLARDYLEGKVSAAAAASRLVSEKSDELASRAWYEFLGSIRPEDMELFFSALHEKGNTGVRAELLPALVARANALDPKLAEQLIDKLPEGSLRMGAIHALFLGSPESILQHAEFLSSLTTDRDVQALGIAYSDALVKLDSGSLGKFVASLADGRAKKLALGALASRLGEESQGIDDLSKKLTSAPDKSAGFQETAFMKELEKRKQGSFSEISLSKVDSSQQSALAYATATMIHRTSNATDAMSWLWEQGNGNVEVVTKGVHDTMVRWLNSDPIEASKWLNEQASGPLKDVALGRLIQYLDQGHEKDQRAAWIQQFSDPALIKRYSGGK